MAIKCGRCQNHHESIADVRECFNGGKVTIVAVAQAASRKADQPTDKQWKFLNDLREQAGLPRLSDDKRANLTKRSISEAINDAKLDVAQAEREANGLRRRPTDKHLKTADYPAIQEGYYAVPSLTGNNDLDFFRVDVPSKGNWVGCLFVKRIIGGHEPTRVAKATAGAWLDLIRDETMARKSMEIYGQEMGRCGKCGRTLTDEASRAVGMGPDCREKY